jgi:UDP-N-acetyl-D-galactosamine dehydrogenase
VVDVVKTLQSYYLNVFVSDPFADSYELKEEYGIDLINEIDTDYDAVIISVPHQPYLSFDNSYFNSITKPNALIADLKGVFKDEIKDRKYWSF